MHLVDLAKEHRADAMAAADRGRLVREVSRARQRRAKGMWIVLAVRDLGRRLWGWSLTHSPGPELEVAEPAAVLRRFPNAVEAGELSIHPGAAVRLEGTGLALEAPGGHQMVCRRVGVSERRAQVRSILSANGRRATDHGSPTHIHAQEGTR